MPAKIPVIVAAILMVMVGSAKAQTTAPAPKIGAFHQPLEETIEWMVADSKAVVHATIEASPEDRITFRIREVIKGDLAGGSVVSVEKKPAVPQDRYTPGRSVLLFLQENKSRHAERFPYRLRGGRGGYLLDGTEPAYPMNLSVVALPQEIIAAAKEAAAYPSVASDYVLLGGPLVSGRASLFPMDERLEKAAQRWAAGKSIPHRVLALRTLKDFKSDANVALAMKLLEDTRTNNPKGIGKWQAGLYDVRWAASNLLTQWKVEHPNLPDSGPVYIYQPIRFSRGSLLWPGAGLLVMVAMLIWRKSAITNWTIGIVALAAVVGLSLLWHRSMRQADELMFQTGKVHHEIASYRGGVQYLLMRDWTMQSEAVIGHFELVAYGDAWSTELLSPKPNSRLAFVPRNVTAPGPGNATHPATFFRIPYWVLVVPFALVLLRQCRLLLRQIRRRRLGLCRNCGYDLRECSNGTCPECGLAHVRKLAA